MRVLRSIRSSLVSSVLPATLLVASAHVRVAHAQPGVGATVTPYAGYLVTGNWYDGPIGTSLATSNSPMVGVQGTVPLTRGIALVGNLAYANGDLRIGLPVIGGVNVGSATTWLYDAGIEVGGLAGKATGIAPFVQGGIGGMTSAIENRLLNVRASSVAYTGAVGIDIGLSRGFALRVQGKDWISRFNSEDAIGVNIEGNRTHNWALSAGVRLGF